MMRADHKEAIREVTDAVVSRLGFWAFVLWGVYGVISVLSWAATPHDDTDPPNGRSGVTIVTDYGTGCQYLKTPGGGITPRLGTTCTGRP